MALLVGVEVLEPMQGLEDRVIIRRSPRQTHGRAQQRTHRTNAIDKASADKRGTACWPARSMLSEKRVQVLANLHITGRRLRENRAERCQQLLVQQRPITMRGKRPSRCPTPQVGNLAADHHQPPIGGEQEAISQEAGGLHTARGFLNQRSG